MSTKKYTELSFKIKKIRESYNLTKVAFAKRLFISPAYVTDLESGKNKKISATLAKLISYEFNIDIDWLLTDEGEMKKEDVLQPPTGKVFTCSDIEFNITPPAMNLIIADKHAVNKFTNSEREEYYAPIPLLSDSAAAGDPRVINDDDIEGYAVFYYSWIRGRKMVAVRIKGDSMTPTLMDGSIVGIDLNDRQFQPEKIFAVRYKGGCTIKRLTKDRQFLILNSDNPDKTEYPNQAVNLQDDTDAIIGRVAFAWLIL